MKQRFSGRTVIAFGLGVGSLLAQGQGQNGGAGRPSDEDPGFKVAIHSRNQLEEAPTKGGTTSLSPITDHGGPKMGTPNPYLIWYGNWNQSNATDTPGGQAIVRDFLAGLSNSGYYQINMSYNGPTGAVGAVRETIDTGSQGTHLSDNAIKAIVNSAIGSGRLGAADPNGVYFVLTSSNIAKTGFCSQYCGWHTYTTIGATKVKYSFVGNAARCLNSCAAQTVGPNGNAGVDGMVSVLAHELEEANTDPLLNAWYDSSGAENADKCAWTFGQNQSVLGTGAYYNLTLGSRNFLIQRNLSATDNKCYVDIKTKAQ
ncbi:MAG: hypothetical protein ABI806_06525 [Candidatus Solibacter sp.]